LKKKTLDTLTIVGAVVIALIIIAIVYNDLIFPQ